MDRKIKFRILGIVLVIGLVVILLPLFEHNSEMSSQKVAINMPPFPDQAVQVNVDTENPDKLQSAVPQVPLQTTENNVQQQSEELVRALRPKLINQSAKDLVEISTPTKNVATKKPISTKVAPKAEARIATAAINSVNLQEIFRNDLRMDDENGLVKLKNSVWVIQIGSFNNKANALRLVNQLRSGGYRAFIQQVKTTFGQNTRVFVGPLNKQTSARALASQLESDMHLRGIVVSYKPLEM